MATGTAPEVGAMSFRDGAFRDRVDAGQQLAARLAHLRGPDVVVLGLPRGGVPVAAEVARGLGAPLDVVVVRKLGLPEQPELAMGAVGEGGVVVRVENVLRAAAVPPETFAAVERRESAELARRVAHLRAVRPRVPLAGRTVVIVDDGIATGSTARAACAVVRAQGAARVVLAAPVVACDTAAALAAEVDELAYVLAPDRFGAVGRHYADFGQTRDDEVVDLLRAGQPL
jgi:putative phosphoribosyl transferase